MTFGEKIKSARLLKKMTQKDLAKIIGAKHNSISDWENDKFKPDMDTVELLCGALDINPSYLMGTKSDEEYGNIIGNLMNEPDILDMIEDYKSLNDSDKKAIRQIISSLCKESRG